MTEIFMSGYNYGSYEDYCEVNLRAFVTEAEALEFNEKHKAAYKHFVRNESALREFIRAWSTNTPFPHNQMVQITTHPPQWEGKKGSKKNAPPEVLAEFQARERKYREECERIQRLNAKLRDDWNAAAISGLRAKMAELGCTQEEIDAQQGFYIQSDDEREYTVETVPFGPEATDV